MVKGLQTEWGACSRTVSFDGTPLALACQKDLTAVGFKSNNITILNAITGISMSILSSHIGWVVSFAFSSDGTLLVSGSVDKTVCLWDIQTGGVITTFHGHTGRVLSVAISPDYTMVASGATDHTIWLWNVQTGKCHCVIEGHSDAVSSVSFSPTNSQLLWSASYDGTVRQWDIEGHQIGSVYEGDYVALSSDGSKCVLWKYRKAVAVVQDSDSGRVIAELQSPGGATYHWCFSPDGRFIVSSTGGTIYVWDITNSDPCLVETFTGHTCDITSLVFSSSLISSSEDGSIRFWKIGASSMDPVAANLESIPVNSASIECVSLHVTKGIAISSDEDGVVKIWDILTGLCKESFQTPARNYGPKDVQLMDDRLILIWLEGQKVHIWDTKKGELLQVLDVQVPHADEVLDFRISGDRSKVFILDQKFIRAWSTVTEEVAFVKLKGEPLSDSLIMDGSRVWVYFEDLQAQECDFGLLGPVPVPSVNSPHGGHHLCFIGTRCQGISQFKIIDALIRKEIFRLSEKYANPKMARWDGQYLIAGYYSGEVIILDFSHLILH